MSALHIASASDARFFPGLAVSLGSAVLSSTGRRTYRITVIDGGLEPGQRSFLEAWLPKLGTEVGTPVHVSFADVSHPVFQRFPLRRGSRLTWARMAIPFLFPGEDVVYLDSDVVCLRGIEGFVDASPRNDHGVVAVRDPVQSLGRDKSLRHLVGPDEAERPYFNAGIILLRCPVLNGLGFQEKVLEEIKRVEAPRYADQSVLNLLVGGSWTEVPVEFNYLLTVARAAALLQDPAPANLHYIGPRKPWMPAPSAFDRYFFDLVWHQVHASTGLEVEAPALDRTGLRKARRRSLLYRILNPSRARWYAENVRAFDRARNAGPDALPERIAGHPDTPPAVAAALRGEGPG